MSKLLRYFRPGQICFLTSVTFQRRPILTEFPDLAQSMAGHLISRFGCEVIAWIVLPDHYHVLINSCNEDLCSVMKRSKLAFAYKYRKRKGLNFGAIWQSRFWDHVIRDEKDMATHFDYIHYNPVKHGLVRSPAEWQFSSFHDYAAAGYYESDWGVHEPENIGGDFGE